MKKVSRLLPALLLCIAGGQVTAQKLLLNLAKNTRYQAVTETKMVNNVEAMGQTMEMTGNTSSTALYEVKDVRNNEYDLVKTLQKTAMNMVVPGQEMSYDSEKKDNDEKMKALGAKVGKPFAMTVDKTGSITKQDAAQPNEISEMVNGMMNASSGSETEELYATNLLNRTIKAGEQWQDSSSNKTDKMSTKMSGVYTVKTVENGIATIAYDGMQNINGTMEQNGMEMTTTGNNKVSSELLVDVKTGITLQRKTNIVLNNSIEVMGMTMPSTGTVTTTTILKPVQ